MDTNIKSTSNTTRASVPEPATTSRMDPGPTRSGDSSVTAPTEYPAEPSETTETTRPDGPLLTLAQKAADTQLGRAARQKIPDSARPSLDHASRVLNTMDSHILAAKGTLDTDEGRRVFKSGCEFVSSLLAFTAMLFTAGVASAERRLDIEPDNNSSAQRFVRVCREAASRVRTRAEAREKQVHGTSEAWLYAQARRAMDIISTAFRSSLKALSEFSGPGKEYVAPAADSLIRMLSKDMQAAVRESKGPIEAIRNSLGLERSNVSDNGFTETAHEPESLGNSMKND